MDRVFDSFGFGRGWTAPRIARGWLSPSGHHEWSWSPAVEMFHRGSELVVRADLPGLKREDIQVDVNDDRLTLTGERKYEHEEEREGVYRSERSYGTFRRDIPLPPGTMSDQAKATFRDGVLEITVPAPPESTRQGRRLQIAEGASDVKPHVEK
jgi:HSP20 family protein